MSIDVFFTSMRKGSNPGGMCDLVEQGSLFFKAYLKYCYGPAFVQGTTFKGFHQPIYEAVTFNLARWVGMKTADYYVLLDGDGGVNFHNWKKYGGCYLSGRPYYFVSKIVDRLEDSSNESHIKSKEIVNNHKNYLDALLIEDIVGRRQNYVFCSSEKISDVIYIDLGHSFVRASNGRLKHIKRKGLMKNKRERNRVIKKLSRYRLLSASGLEMIDLEKIPEVIKSIMIPTLNPTSKVSLLDFVDSDELEDIISHILWGFDKVSKKMINGGFFVHK